MSNERQKKDTIFCCILERKKQICISLTDLVGIHRCNNCAMNQCLVEVSDDNKRREIMTRIFIHMLDHMNEPYERISNEYIILCFVTSQSWKLYVCCIIVAGRFLMFLCGLIWQQVL